MKKLNRVIKIKEILQKELCSQTPIKESRRSKSIVNKNKNVFNSTKKHYNYTDFHNIDKYNNNILNKKYDAVSKLTKILIDQRSSYDYINSIIVLFTKFFNYIIIKKIKHKTKTIITKNIDNTFNVQYIDIEEVFEFLNNKKINNYNNSSLSNISSRMRKFVRILNNNKNINYINEIPKTVKNENSLKLTKDELNNIFEYIKFNYNTQILLIFYFIYFLGLTFSKVARIKITDFKSDFSILVEKKEKYKKYMIPNIIANILLYYIKNKTNNSLYLFYDSIKDNKTFTRTQLIRNNISNVIKGCKVFSNIKSEEIIKSFSKKRNSKRLNENLYYLFNINIYCLDDTNSNKNMEPKDLSEKSELYSTSHLSNNMSLIDVDELYENNNHNASFDNINDMNYVKKRNLEKTGKEYKFIKKKTKKKRLDYNYIKYK